MIKSQSIYFVMRSDAFAKPGGDMLQVENYAVHLRNMGWDVHILEFRLSMCFPNGSIVHLVNVDRVFDFLIAARLAKGSKCRVVASPIHHSLSKTRLMRRSADSRSWLRRALNSLPETARELVAFVTRCCRTDGLWRRMGLPTPLAAARAAAPYAFRPWHAAGRVLDACEAVFVLAQGEAKDLRRDTGWAGNNQILTPNGVSVPQDILPPPWAERHGLLVVGRIESRKRTLELANRAHARGISVAFIGSRSPTEPVYSAEFVRMAVESPFINYRGSMTHADVLKEMAHARVLLSASFVEVQSLVELEAITLGCRVVGTPSGNTGDYVDEAVYRQTASFSIDELLDAAIDAHEDGPPAVGRQYRYSWETTASVLHDVYMGRR